MKVLHVSTYDANGGAGRAAYALHSAELSIGLDSRMMVASSSMSDSTVTALSGIADKRWRLSQRLDRRIWDLQKSPNTQWRSPAVFGALDAEAINRSPADVVNLHWVTNGFASIRQIGRITKPIVWSMYDMWPFTGTEHYGADTPDARWRVGYTRANREASESGVDIDRQAWERKCRYWLSPMHMVPASAWLLDRVQASALCGEWPTHQIPHVVDTAVFAPLDEAAARAQFGLPIDRSLILFLASGGVLDQRKGWDLLDDALLRARVDLPDTDVVIAGPVPAGFQPRSGVTIHSVGDVIGNDRLRALYAAATVVAVPSREDTMPLTAMEAHACGIPVVAFSIGGLPDIVEHTRTGYLATPFDVDDLAQGLRATVMSTRGSLGTNARSKALAQWSPSVVASSYHEVYQAAISTHRGGSN